MRSTRTGFVLFGVVALAATLAAAPASAISLDVTITNATPGQVFSAPVLATHSSGFDLFEVGEAISPELADLAKDGVSDGLVGVLMADPNVLDVAVGGGNIPPGESMTLTIDADAGHRFVSFASMLVTTNDAFVALDGLLLDSTMSKVSAIAYDAGAEDNSENCAHIPGPPCNNPMVDNGTGEGFVAVHAGIHGLLDLAPARDDWRNPVAVITFSVSP